MNLNRPLTAALFMVVVAALTGGVSYAQTPDGQTPAEEDVCDELSGAAFGLCNAYCEAMDCHLGTDGDPETSPNASDVACLRVLNNFIKITGMEELPCEAADCPPDAGTEGCDCDNDNLFCGGELACDEGTMTCQAPDNGEN